MNMMKDKEKRPMKMHECEGEGSPNNSDTVLHETESTPGAATEVYLNLNLNQNLSLQTPSPTARCKRNYFAEAR
jgi:hypothetical protein